MNRQQPRTSSDLDEFAAARRARRKKSQWKRPRRIFSLWARLGMLAAVIVITIFLSISLVAKALRPYREAGLQKSQLAVTRQESDALAVENADLARRIAYLKTPEGVASEARNLGYLRPGEIPIVVEGGAHPGKETAPAPLSGAEPAAHAGNAASRFWHHLTGN